MANAEYEIQLYGYTIAQIGLKRRYLFEMRLNDAIDALLSKISASVSAATGTLLKEQKKCVVQKILNNMEKHFEALEMLDRKLFVPEHILLETDFEHSKKYDEETEKALDKKIEELQQLYLENSVMVTSLDMEAMRFNNVKKYIDEQVEIQSQVEQCLKAFDAKKLLTLISETKSVIQTLEEKK